MRSLRQVEADEQRELREARRFVAAHGVGQVEDPRMTLNRTMAGTKNDGLPRKHREELSYSQFGTLDAWENWLVETGQSYNPLVGRSAELTELQLEKQGRMEHVMSYLSRQQRELLYSIYVERETQAEVALKEGVTQQAVSKRLQAATGAFIVAFNLHWNDEQEDGQ